MAANLYRVSRPLGKSVVAELNEIGERFARLKLLRAAMVQQKDANSEPPVASDFETAAAVFGFVDAAGQISPAVAMAAFLELDSFVGTAGPSLEQCCARFRQ